MRHQLQQQNDELEAWRTNLERDLEAARLTQQSLIPQKPPRSRRLGRGRSLPARHSSRAATSTDGCAWPMAERFSGSWTPPGTALPPPFSPRWPNCSFITEAVEHTRPAAIMRAVNNDFRSIFGARSFMTAMCVALDPASGRVDRRWRGSSAVVGRAARRRNGSDSFLRAAARVGRTLRIHRRREVDLDPGDAFLLYTDGLYRCGACEWTAAHAYDDWGKCCNLPDAMRTPCSPRSSNKRDAMNGDKPLADDVAAIAVKRAE